MGYHRHLLGLPLTFFNSRRTGEILSRWTDAVKIRLAVSTTTLGIIVDGLLLISTSVIMLFMNWRVTVIPLSIIPITVGFVLALNGSLRRHQRTAMEKAGELEAIVVETIEAIRTIKAFRAETNFRVRTEARFMEMLNSSFQSQMVATQCVVGTTFASGLAAVLLLWLGGRQVMDGAITVGQLMSLNTMLGMFVGPLERLSSANQAVQDAIVATDRLGEVFDLQLEKSAESANAIDRRIDGKVEFRNVTFRYGSRRPVLENLSLQVEEGECVGIVGPSGSGKTTLLQLLGRFFEVEAGSILIDGIVIEEYGFDCLRREIAFVPQDIVLFNASIAENIRIGRSSASADEVYLAAHQAGVDEIVNRLTSGFETIVGERGLSLSGGERQRVGLARALLQDPAILVLDEPTSHLDTASEAAVRAILTQRRGRRTTIVSSHRLLDFDRIIELSAAVCV
jgi:ATP-binding cassette subfamily B protein